MPSAHDPPAPTLDGASVAQAHTAGWYRTEALPSLGHVAWMAPHSPLSFQASFQKGVVIEFPAHETHVESFYLPDDKEQPTPFVLHAPSPSPSLDFR